MYVHRIASVVGGFNGYLEDVLFYVVGCVLTVHLNFLDFCRERESVTIRFWFLCYCLKLLGLYIYTRSFEVNTEQEFGYVETGPGLEIIQCSRAYELIVYLSLKIGQSDEFLVV